MKLSRKMSGKRERASKQNSDESRQVAGELNPIRDTTSRHEQGGGEMNP